MRLRILPALFTVVAGLLAQDGAGLSALEPGKERSCELAAGQSQEHYVLLRAGQYARFIITQHTVDVRVGVFDPAGEQLLAVDDSPIGEAEDVELIAVIPGKYRLRVSGSEAHAPSGRYGVMLSGVEPESARYRTRTTAAWEVALATAASRRGTRDAMLQAIRYFESARLHWGAAGDPVQEARMMDAIAFRYIDLGDRDKALSYAISALPLARTANDRQLLGRVLDCIGEVYNNFSDKKTAIAYYGQALPLLRAAGDRAGEAQTINNLGVAYLGTGDKLKALEMFEQSKGLLQMVQDRRTLAKVASNIGATHDKLGDYPRALESLQYALALRRELGDRAAEGLALNNLGSAYSGLAEYQKALDAYLAALEIHRAYDSRWNMAVTLNNIGWVYAALGDRRHALRSYQESLDLSRAIQDPRRTAVALNNIANIYAGLADYHKAIELHVEALGLRRRTEDPDGEATSLTNLGEAYAKVGETGKAREHFEAALAILRTSANRPKLVRALRGFGALKRNDGHFEESRKCLDEALSISRDMRDQNGEVSVLGELARLEYDLCNLQAAYRLAEQTLAALESLRLRVVSPNLRASLVASTREVHELNIEILQRLHAESPSNGFDAEALRAAERGRARSLLDVLVESGAAIRSGVDEALLGRERDLQLLVANRADRQTQILDGKHTSEEANAASRELDRAAADLEQLQSRIREVSPQYAALTSPATLEVKEIQRKVLDPDTVLLEYELGTRKSFLWVVTSSSVTSFELGPRAQIESDARHVCELLTARNLSIRGETPAARAARLRTADRDYYAVAARLSDMLIGPAAVQIAGKRLLIVAEGALQYLPFSALPEPGKQVPLMVEHEVVTAPSASVLAVLRQETAARQPAEQLMFVAADPVYSAADARLEQHRIASSAAYGNEPFLRLRFSRSEADQIASLVPAADVVKAFDFDANRDAVLNADLARFRILHFATHSVLDDERPELSGIVLSLVDSAGRRQNGFLRLLDIYSLRLNADLVVLSACRTALGPEIRGEGLIGFTRGFFYAGAPRVLASLWQIDDRTGAAFMKPFYEAMLVRHERPAAALRSAQIALWTTKGWDAPYYWAAFTLQGEWK